MKASFFHLPLSLFEGRLARKLRFHIFNFHFWRDASHESYVLTSSIATFEGSLQRKLRFHIFNFQILRDVSRLCFHIFYLQILREISQESFVFTSDL